MHHLRLLEFSILKRAGTDVAVPEALTYCNQRFAPHLPGWPYSAVSSQYRNTAATISVCSVERFSGAIHPCGMALLLTILSLLAKAGGWDMPSRQANESNVSRRLYMTF